MLIKKTRSRGTIAKGGGLAKRPRSAKGLPFSCSRVGRRPVGNSLDHLVGAAEQHRFVSLTRSSMVLDCLAIAVSVLLSAGIRNAWAITLGSSPAQGRLVASYLTELVLQIAHLHPNVPGGRTAEYETAERAHERPEPCCYREQRDSGASRSMGSNRLVLFPPLRR